MFKCVRTARALLLGLFVVGVVSGCSLPLLESQGEGGPRVSDIVDHVNCELALLIQLSEMNIEEIERIQPDTSTSLGRLVTRIKAEPESWEKYKQLLRHLTEDHFVASVTMILDVLNTQGLNPSLSFISPINNSMSFNQSFGIGGSLTGSQERNISLNYSVDLDQLKVKPIGVRNGKKVREDYAEAHNCPASVVAGGLSGDLGLADIVIDGLFGLDVSRTVNIYGNAGPSPLPMTYQLTNWFMTLHFDKDANHPNPYDLEMDFNGNISFSPSTTDLRSSGTLSLTGVVIPVDQVDPKRGALEQEKDSRGEIIKDKNGKPIYVRKSGHPVDNNSYFINLTGSTFQRSSEHLDFLFTGTMTQSTPTDIDYLQNLGFSPKLTFAGTINNKDKVLYSPIRMTQGSISSDTTAKAIVLSPPLAPAANNPGALSVPVQLCQFEQLSAQFLGITECQLPKAREKGGEKGFLPVAGAGVGAGGGSSSKVGGTTPSAASTQFSSLVNFIISYGLNGGPNWTLATFKGPGGGGGGGGSGSGSGGGGGGSGGGSGGGGGGQLASINRTDTDTLTITFVAACKTGDNSARPTDYWDALSRCNQSSKVAAGTIGYQANQNFLLLQRLGP